MNVIDMLVHAKMTADNWPVFVGVFVIGVPAAVGVIGLGLSQLPVLRRG